jgi:hypothetical protein
VRVRRLGQLAMATRAFGEEIGDPELGRDVKGAT